MDTQPRRRHLPVRAFLGLAGAALLAGCGILDSDEPTSARLVLGGAAGHSLELIISDDFEVLIDQETQERSVEIASADTMSVSAPFDQKYDLGPQARFYAKLDSESTPSSLVSMKVYVGGEVQYNRLTDFDGEFLEFIYTIR